MEVQRKGNQRGTPTPSVGVPLGHFQSGMFDARDERKDGRKCVVPLC